MDILKASKEMLVRRWEDALKCMQKRDETMETLNKKRLEATLKFKKQKKFVMRYRLGCLCVCVCFSIIQNKFKTYVETKFAPLRSNINKKSRKIMLCGRICRQHSKVAQRKTNNCANCKIRFGLCVFPLPCDPKK